jgi:hypothetical protein
MRSELPLREWLELGQAIIDKSVIAPRYFRKYHTLSIRIGRGLSVEADGRIYKAGEYVLNECLTSPRPTGSIPITATPKAVPAASPSP